MTSIAKIQEDILALSETDYLQLRQWFNALDRDEWERQIAADSNAGKLDFLIVEALEAEEKEDMIHELDAVVAHLYGLNERQLRHIFETFHEGWDYEDRLRATLKHFEGWKRQL